MTLYHCLKPAHIYAQPCDDCPDPSLCQLRDDAGVSPPPPEPELLGVIELPIMPCLNPYVKWYRHPIWWWKWRHLRKDVKVMTEAVDPEFKRKFDEELDRVMLFGNGGN